ncbi:MAG TPA: SRPBCC family protein [Azospirillaceae bacterium]|nr:SRPBCC family protein [Azospirillaceae bacterium]
MAQAVPAGTMGIWPAGLDPATAPVYAFAERTMAADPAAVWEWLVRPRLWPRYYGHAFFIDVPGDGRLAPDVTFRWFTLGVRVTTRVDEFLPGRRLAWWGTGAGAQGYHSWDILPDPQGRPGHCRVVTEECQSGLVPSLLRPVLRPLLHHVHGRWLAGLERAAAQGMPRD